MKLLNAVATKMGAQPEAAVRVMIVEDDPGMLERFAAALVRDPRTRVVEKVRTGKDALARLLLVTPDVLLVDLGLPDIHGTEVIRFAARTLPECDIMVVTVFGDERNVIGSIEAGATGYVLKDCSDADLIARVLELRAGGSPMSPGIARIVLNQMRAGTGAGAAPKRREEGNGATSALTARETDVLRLLSRGYTYSEVGDRLGISVHTVTSHIKNSYRKLAVRTGTAAVTRAAELGLLRQGGDKGSGAG
jgi:DNA-binding NarL/FixJ family response regulator